MEILRKMRNRRKGKCCDGTVKGNTLSVILIIKSYNDKEKNREIFIITQAINHGGHLLNAY